MSVGTELLVTETPAAPPVAAADEALMDRSSSPSGAMAAIAVIAGGAVGAAVLIAVALFCCLRRKRRKGEGGSEGHLSKASARREEDRPRSLTGPAKVFPAMEGGGDDLEEGVDGDGDDEPVAYSWTRENSGVNFGSNRAATEALEKTEEGDADGGEVDDHGSGDPSGGDVAGAALASVEALSQGSSVPEVLSTRSGRSDPALPVHWPSLTSQAGHRPRCHKSWIAPRF